MGNERASGSNLVYSTDQGRLCPACGAAIANCTCRRKAATAPVAPSAAGGVVRVSRETKGRSGKGVTIVSGLALGEAQLTTLARELKARCATGGTLRDGTIELQGEHRDTLVKELTRRGYLVKRAGG